MDGQTLLSPSQDESGQYRMVVVRTRRRQADDGVSGTKQWIDHCFLQQQPIDHGHIHMVTLSHPPHPMP